MYIFGLHESYIVISNFSLLFKPGVRTGRRRTWFLRIASVHECLYVCMCVYVCVHPQGY